MKKFPKTLCVICCALFMGSCFDTSTKNPLERALASKDVRIKRVMDSIAFHEVQIRYTRIDREGDSIIFKDFDFQVDDSTYFYPASTIKFPAVVAALEKLNELDTLYQNTKFYIEGDTLQTSFSEAILQIFAISNNDANNRLIEFLGFDDLNVRMFNRRVTPFRVSHRLSTVNADDVTTKPLVIYLNDSTTSISNRLVSGLPQLLKLKKVKKGKGFHDEDSLILAPFDFSLKNYFPINAQQALLKRIIFPQAFSKMERFNLTENQRTYLLEAMQILPSEVGYDDKIYYNSYGKFFMFGDSKEPMPNHIKIYNKVGYAYGTLTDCAYIKDIENDIDFMLTATILVNRNQVFNDDTYEYDEIGIPFLAQLGREIYDYELKRKR